MRSGLVLTLLLAGSSWGGQSPGTGKPPQGRRFQDLGYDRAFTRERFQTLLQTVVDRVYMKGFRDLGVTDDFFHGHILYLRGGAEAVAVLYHTQENLSAAQFIPVSDGYRYLDRGARNWLQRLDDPGRVENVLAFERAEYPAGGTPAFLDLYREHFTVTPEMLDPRILGGEIARDVQWSFFRIDCGDPDRPVPPDSDVLAVTLPTRETVCLELQPSL